MHFLSIKMNENMRRAYIEAGHELLLFGYTREQAPDGTAACVILASSDCFQLLVHASVEHALKDKGRMVTHYIVYGTHDVELGLALGAQERKAKEN